MARTLIITNADFSVNKLTTVEFGDDIPCTGIELDKSVSSLNQIGGTDTITATVSPVDTTDSVIWSTSDADVATVVGGTVTAIGCGTATITATCGSFSATCTVTVVHIVELTRLINTYLSKDDSKDYLTGGALDNYGIAYTTTGSKTISGSNGMSGRYPCPIPNGANNIVIETNDLCPYGFWLSTDTPSAHSQSVAKAFAKDSFGTIPTTAGNRTAEIPDRTTGTYEGVNAVAICLRYRAGTITQGILDAAVIKFTA